MGTKPGILRRVLLTVAIASVFLGLGFLYTYSTSLVQPGGPACYPGSPCPQSVWYLTSTRTVEIVLGAAFLIIGNGLVVLLLLGRIPLSRQRPATQK